MLRSVCFVLLAFGVFQADPPTSAVVHIKVPVGRHALLISEDPPTAAPRRIVTTPEGTADIRVRPGRYIVESDRPAIVSGRAYQWTETVTVVGGRDVTLELTMANATAVAMPAEPEPAPARADDPAAAPLAEAAPAVTIWTPYTRMDGTLVTGKDLVTTSRSSAGDATTVEVQLSPTEKVSGRVISGNSIDDTADVQFDRAARLPLEPSKPLPPDMKSSTGRGFSLSPYSVTSADFEIVFITPLLLASAKAVEGHSGGPTDTLSGLRAVTEFGDWAGYVSEWPPVVFIRVTPKLVESFWLKLARGAAATQGSSIPAIKHVGPGFSRMRVLCGEKEVAPIHPLRIRTPTSETSAVDEGFYVFDPMMIGPYCSTVSLVLSSVKDPTKTETRAVSPAVISQVWKDFASWREAR